MIFLNICCYVCVNKKLLIKFKMFNFYSCNYEEIVYMLLYVLILVLVGVFFVLYKNNY